MMTGFAFCSNMTRFSLQGTGSFRWSRYLKTDETFIRRIAADLNLKTYSDIIFNYEVTGNIVIEIWAPKQTKCKYAITVYDNGSYVIDEDNTHSLNGFGSSIDPEEISQLLSSNLLNVARNMKTISFPITEEYILQQLTLNLPDELELLKMRNKLSKYGI